MQRIRRRIGDRALSDKCKSHDEVDRRRFSLVFRKFVFEQDGRQGDRTGRNHTADHDCCHDVIVSCRDRCCSEHIRRLVERAAHIDRHHSSDDNAKQNLTASTHIGKSRIKCRVKRSDRRLHNIGHDQTDKKDTEERVQQYGRDFFDRFRQF